jgi:hypothetical protein
MSRPRSSYSSRRIRPRPMPISKGSAKRVYDCVRYLETHNFDEAPPEKLQRALNHALELETELDMIADGLESSEKSEPCVVRYLELPR